jgi:hypothetical protein
LNTEPNPDDSAHITGSALATAASLRRDNVLRLLLEYGAEVEKQALEDAMRENAFGAQILLGEARDKQLKAISHRHCKKKGIVLPCVAQTPMGWNQSM